jgi:hypothetical protein
MATPSPRSMGAWLGPVIVAGFAVVSALLFAGIYLAVPQGDHFYSLIGIGILSLVFALGGYLAQAAAPDPALPRALSWGYTGLGFALLFGTVLLNPGSVLGYLAQVAVLTLVILALLVTLVGVYWRHRAIVTEEARQEHREAWRGQPTPSALDYAAAEHDRSVTSNACSAPKGPS